MFKSKKQIQRINNEFSKHDQIIKEAKKLTRKLKRMKKEILREMDSDWLFSTPNPYSPFYLGQPPYWAV